MYAYVFFVFVHDDKHGIVPYSVWSVEADAEYACFELVSKGLDASVIKLPVESNMSEKNGKHIH